MNEIKSSSSLLSKLSRQPVTKAVKKIANVIAQDTDISLSLFTWRTESPFLVIRRILDAAGSDAQGCVHLWVEKNVQIFVRTSFFILFD